MNQPPKPPSELAVELSSRELAERTETEIYRQKRGKVRREQLVTNGELHQLILDGAREMAKIFKDETAEVGERTAAFKATADGVKAHASLQAATIRLHDLDDGSDPKPSGPQMRPPAPPTQILAQHATFNMGGKADIVTVPATTKPA